MGGQQSAPVPQWVLDQQMRANTPQLSNPGNFSPVRPIIIQQAPQVQRPVFQPQRARQPMGPPLQQTPVTMGAVGTGAVGTGVVGTGAVGMGAARPAAVGAAPAQISYQAPRPVKQQGPAGQLGPAAGPVTMAQITGPATRPVTMAQLTGPQKFLGGYFTGGPDDSGICPTSIMFLLILIIIISVAIILSSYSCSENASDAEKPLLTSK
jgi:hypothetical protein